jgi:hypothetical protein
LADCPYAWNANSDRVNMQSLLIVRIFIEL